MTIYLHAGTHKTGSKSFQALLGENIDLLRDLGYDVFVGSHRNPRNHTELHLASQRPERDSLAKHNWPDMVLGPDYEEQIGRNVRRFLNDSSLPNQVFSNEDLAFLRYPDEFARLLTLFERPAADFVVTIVTRNPADFLISYRKQILKKPGRIPLNDPASALYIEPDTWLLDYGALIYGFRTYFGAEVRLIDYDAEISNEGSILPALLRSIDLDPGLIPNREFRMNATRT